MFRVGSVCRHFCSVRCVICCIMPGWPMRNTTSTQTPEPETGLESSVSRGTTRNASPDLSRDRIVQHCHTNEHRPRIDDPLWF